MALRPLAATSSRSAARRSSFRTFACNRIEVANLLQPQHQFEDVLDRGSLAQSRQADNAFLFGQAVAFPLLGGKFDVGIAEDLGRQIGKDFVLGAARI